MEKVVINMKITAGKFALKFGTCVILASLFSGCASNGAYGPRRTAMIDPDELKWFSPDCGKAPEQIRWLNSLRQTDDDQLFSVAGWLGEGKRVNWLINQHLHYIKSYC